MLTTSAASFVSPRKPFPKPLACGRIPTGGRLWLIDVLASSGTSSSFLGPDLWPGIIVFQVFLICKLTKLRLGPTKLVDSILNGKRFTGGSLSNGFLLLRVKKPSGLICFSSVTPSRYKSAHRPDPCEYDDFTFFPTIQLFLCILILYESNAAILHPSKRKRR